MSFRTQRGTTYARRSSNAACRLYFATDKRNMKKRLAVFSMQGGRNPAGVTPKGSKKIKALKRRRLQSFGVLKKCHPEEGNDEGSRLHVLPNIRRREEIYRLIVFYGSLTNKYVIRAPRNRPSWKALVRTNPSRKDPLRKYRPGTVSLQTHPSGPCNARAGGSIYPFTATVSISTFTPIGSRATW